MLFKTLMEFYYEILFINGYGMATAARICIKMNDEYNDLQGQSNWIRFPLRDTFSPQLKRIISV